MTKPIDYYFDWLSQPSRSLYIIFNLSGTSFTAHPISLGNGEHLTEKYRTEVNRFKKVPCIVDDGFQLSESVAIIRYLDQKNQIARHLYPTEPKTRARVDEYLSWQHLTLRLGCASYFRYKFLEPAVFKAPINEVKIAEYKKLMEDSLDIFENVWLGSKKYVAGDELTVADIFAASEIEETKIAGYDATEGRPKLAEWLENVRWSTCPHYDDAHKVVNQMAASVGFKVKSLTTEMAKNFQN